jgi:hypothetical protein
MSPVQSFAVTAIGRLALAAVFNGPRIAKVSPRPGGKAGVPAKSTVRTLPVQAALPQAALFATVAAGWLGERKKLLGQNLDKDAKAMVHLKDVLVGGAVLTGVANVLAEQLIRRNYGEIQVTAAGELSPDAPAGLDEYAHYLHVVSVIHRVFVGAAVAVTPFINFALFNDYRPNPVPRFFAL